LPGFKQPGARFLEPIAITLPLRCLVSGFSMGRPCSPDRQLLRPALPLPVLPAANPDSVQNQASRERYI